MTQQTLYLTEPGQSGPITVSDINQGGIGDCYILASIGEQALYHPGFIQGAITDNGNGTQTVALYTLNGSDQQGNSVFKSTPQTVSDSTFLSNGVNSSGQTTVNGVTEIWPSVMEEAFAQAGGGYSSISSGGYVADAMSQLTGRSVSVLSPASVTGSMLQADQAAGDPIVFATHAATNLPFGLFNNHAYMYEGTTTVNGAVDVIAGNPWGFDQPQAIPVALLSSAFADVYVGSYGAPNLSQPYTPPPPPATETMVLQMSEDAYKGDAEFTVTVDGSQIGGIDTVTALHSGSANGAGSEAFRIGGQWSDTDHQIEITYLNDAYGGSPSNDRNLYVDAINMGDNLVFPTSAELTGYGPGQSGQQTTTFNTHGHFAAGPAPGLVVSLTEDAWLGDAHYRLAVDGVDRGGIRTESVLRTGGQGTDRIDLGALPSGQHSVEVTFINDAYGGSPSTDRNLYLAGATYDGAPVQGGSAALMGDGTYTFSVLATPPVGAAPGSGADPTLAAITPDTLGHSVAPLAGLSFMGDASLSAGSGHSIPFEIARVTQSAMDLIGSPTAQALQFGVSGWDPTQASPATAAWSLDRHLALYSGPASMDSLASAH